MKRKLITLFILYAILTDLTVYIVFSAITQFVADKTLGVYVWTKTNVGDVIPGTTLRFTGAEFAQENDDGYIIYPTFIDTTTDAVVKLGPIKGSPHIELQNDIVISHIIVDETVILKASAIITGAPRTKDSTYFSRLWDRLLFRE